MNRRRGRVDIFTGYARQGYTLRELVIAAQDTGPDEPMHDGAVTHGLRGY